MQSRASCTAPTEPRPADTGPSIVFLRGDTPLVGGFRLKLGATLLPASSAWFIEYAVIGFDMKQSRLQICP